MPKDIFEKTKSLDINSQVTESLEKALQIVYNEKTYIPKIILITGSLYLVGSFLKKINKSIIIIYFLQSNFAKEAFGDAPTLEDTISPFLNRNNAGIPRTPNLLGDTGFSSTFTLAIVISPSYSDANSSSAGAICLQGPHHSAQKSTTTGSF